MNISKSLQRTMSLAQKAQALKPEDLGPSAYKIARYAHYGMIIGAMLIIATSGFSRTINIVIAGLVTPAFSTSVIWPILELILEKSWPYPERKHIIAGFAISHCIGIAITTMLVIKFI